MENVLLMIVVIFLILMAFSGYRRGAIRILLSMVALVLTLVIASYFTPVVTKLLKEHTPLYDTLYKQMENFVGNKLDQNADGGDAPAQQKALDALPLPDAVTKVLVENNNEESYVKLGSDGLSSYTARSLTIIIMNAVSYIGLFIIISIIFRIIMLLADFISRLPVINGINRLIGTVLGILQGILILWVLCIALTAISGTSFGQQIFTMINNSEFLTFIYNNNFLINIVTSIFNVL